MTCSLEGCGEEPYARGWCRSHYMYWWRTKKEPRANGGHRTKVTPRRYV